MQKRFSQTLWRRGRLKCSKSQTSGEARSIGERVSPPLPWRPPWWAQRSPVPTTMIVIGNGNGTIILRRTTSPCRLWPTTRRDRSSTRPRRSSIIPRIPRRWLTHRPIRPMVRRLSISASPCRCARGRSPIGHKAPRQTSPATHKFLRAVTIRHVSPSVGTTANCHPVLSQEAAMRGLVRKTILAAAIAGSGIFACGGCPGARRRSLARRALAPRTPPLRGARALAPRAAATRRLRARPVVYQRAPIIVQPAPVMMAPAYPQPVDPSLNFNFTIPLR